MGKPLFATLLAVQGLLQAGAQLASQLVGETMFQFRTHLLIDDWPHYLIIYITRALAPASFLLVCHDIYEAHVEWYVVEY